MPRIDNPQTGSPAKLPTLDESPFAKELETKKTAGLAFQEMVTKTAIPDATDATKMLQQEKKVFCSGATLPSLDIFEFQDQVNSAKQNSELVLDRGKDGSLNAIITTPDGKQVSTAGAHPDKTGEAILSPNVKANFDANNHLQGITIDYPDQGVSRKFSLDQSGQLTEIKSQTHGGFQILDEKINPRTGQTSITTA